MNRTTEYVIEDRCDCGWSHRTAKYHVEQDAFREANTARAAHVAQEHT